MDEPSKLKRTQKKSKEKQKKSKEKKRKSQENKPKKEDISKSPMQVVQQRDSDEDTIICSSSDGSTAEEEKPWPLERTITPAWILVENKLVPYTELYNP